jgi:hypothetical protein
MVVYFNVMYRIGELNGFLFCCFFREHNREEIY